MTGDANQVFGEDRLKSNVEKYLAMARSVQKGQILSHDDVVLRKADAKIAPVILSKLVMLLGGR